MSGSAPSSSSRAAPKRIHKLDETVVNKIAAGEIIVRPANAVKEMVENSLDAGATEINIIVKNGGLDMLQIQDNGCGIKREDLAIACERHTTSKIDAFEDLTSLDSFGFRGEALCSISHIAKVKIIARTADSVCAFQMEYGLGKPLGAEKPCAGNVGTTITVENFFYNTPVRRSILTSSSEEYMRLQEVVTKYAMRYAKVGFSLKKFGEHVADIRTASNSSTLENCKLLFGASIAKELLSVEGESEKYHCKVKGYVTNPNYSIKKYTFLLFINGRSVDCSKLRRSLELLYAVHLPKNSFPFIYLAMELPPGLIDVNIHPTKAEVFFRFEEEIIAFICDVVRKKLTACQESRSFTVQSTLPRSISQGSSSVDVEYQLSQGSISSVSSVSSISSSQKKVVDPRRFVRTDSHTQTLDAFLRPPTAVLDTCPHSHGEEKGEGGEKDDGESEVSLTSALVTKQNRRPVELVSVLQLQEKVEDGMDEELRRLVAQHTFVGCASHTTALLQHQTKLYAVDVTKLSEELFYQLILYDFGNFGLIKAAEAVSLDSLMEAAMEFSDEPIADMAERGRVTEKAVDLLISKGKMLADYFSLQFNTKRELVSLPMLLSDYVPPLAELPMYVARLVTEVDWTREKECFDDIARITAQFYSFRRDFYGEKSDGEGEDTTWKWKVEHILFPAFRAMLQPGKSLREDRTFVQLADLPNLYKVFERC